jgi:hypothetical protein
MPDSLREAVGALGAQLGRHLVLGGRCSAEQEQLVRELAQRVFIRYSRGELTQGQLLKIVMTWKGVTDVFGWGGVADSLTPAADLRGPWAYQFGHRYLQLKRPADAETFFRTALDDAPPGSVLHRLAQAELDRLRK